MTDKRRSEEEERARQAEGYTAMISHEMATPLGSIIFFLNYLGSFLASLEEMKEVLNLKEEML